METRLDTKQDRDQAPANTASADTANTTDAPATPDAVVELDRRLAALEQRVEQLPASAPSEVAEAEDAPQAPSGPNLNTQFQEMLAGHRALAATVSGLQHELESKPSRNELDLKANRSELDALLRAGVTPAAVGEPPQPALKVAADGSVDNNALVDAVNRAAAEVAGMRGQVAVLQDRLQGKAEQGGLDDLASQLASLRSRGRTSSRIPEVEPSFAPVDVRESSTSGQGTAEPSVASAAGSNLNNLIKRLEGLEARVAAGASAGPSGSLSGVSEDRAVDSISSLTDVQTVLKDIYGRVDGKADRSALDDALRRLEQKADTSALKTATDQLEKSIAAATGAVAVAPAAAPRAPSPPGDNKPASRGPSIPHDEQTPPLQQQSSQQQWVVSHEMGPEHSTPALEDLRAQVASLANRVSQLATAVPSAAGLDGLMRRKSAAGLEVVDFAGVQGALAALQGQLGELVTRLAGKADAGEVARLELALNSKADVDELAEIRLALGAKADAAALGDLQMAVAGKADQAALDEVRLTAALAADLAGGASGDVGPDGKPTSGSGGYTHLLAAIQGMVGDKANKAELTVLQDQVANKASAEDVALLRAALDEKASAAELAALLSQLPGRAANSEEIASLDQRMGDVFAELANIRAELAALPSAEALAAANGGGASGKDGENSAGLQRMMSALTRDVGTLREGLDTVAHATNVLAVGLDGGGARLSAAGAPATGGVQGRYSEADGGKENRSPRGGYERLVKLLGSGDYRHKMDAFDPAALQLMAQKLAYLEATIKSPGMGRANGVDFGIKELERQVKRLGTDVRLMKDKLIEPSSGAGLGLIVKPGDHAMLAARPITGYRCMACDRPLDQLDVLPGPHVPTQQLPVRVPAATDASTRSQVRSGRGDALSPQSSSQKLVFNNDPNVRSVQNWYKDTQVVAAEVLPRDHVGPHLPPGGWRPSNPGGPTAKPNTQGSLPALSGTKSRGSPTSFDHEPRSPQGVPTLIDGVAANVTLPQIS